MLTVVTTRRLLIVGLLLVFGGFIYRVMSLMSAFAAVGDANPVSDKSRALSDSVASATTATYVIAFGAALVVACGVRLIAQAVDRRRRARE